MSDETVKKITLADLGVDTGEQKEESGIIKPTDVSGLATDNSGNVKASKITDIKEIIPEISPNEKFLKDKMDLIDSGIEREKKNLKETILDPLKAACAAKRIEYEIEHGPIQEGEELIFDNKKEKDTEENIKIEPEVFDEDIAVPNTNKPNKLEETEDDSDDLDEFPEDDDGVYNEIYDEEVKDDEENKEEENDIKEKRKQFSNQVKDKFNNIIKKDLSGFKVSSKPISINRVLNEAAKATSNKATVVLPNTGRKITFSALKGDEIVALNPENYRQDDNMLEAMRNMFSIIYRHDIGANKPTFEKWLKSICDNDVSLLYWGLYKATFQYNNYITYSCPDCNAIFMQEQDVNKMIKPNPEYKDLENRVKAIEAEDNDSCPSMLESNLTPISDRYAVGLKAPSIYSANFETAYLDKNYVKKYATVIGMIQFIDDMYIIDDKSNTLIPIDIKPDPNNVTASIKRKIAAFHQITKQLTTDENAVLTANIYKIMEKSIPPYTFCYPSTDCTGEYTIGAKKGQKCTHHFDERETDTPLTMLFTRHQLVVNASSMEE